MDLNFALQTAEEIPSTTFPFSSTRNTVHRNNGRPLRETENICFSLTKSPVRFYFVNGIWTMSYYFTTIRLQQTHFQVGSYAGTRSVVCEVPFFIAHHLENPNRSEPNKSASESDEITCGVRGLRDYSFHPFHWPTLLSVATVDNATFHP